MEASEAVGSLMGFGALIPQAGKDQGIKKLCSQYP